MVFTVMERAGKVSKRLDDESETTVKASIGVQQLSLISEEEEHSATTPTELS